MNKTRKAEYKESNQEREREKIAARKKYCSSANKIKENFNERFFWGVWGGGKEGLEATLPCQGLG